MNARALRSSDDNQRRAADPGASVFVTANAGSGKTKVLVDRIARLLLEGSKPSAFLCITYTKAAAAEMQRRLFERLGGWCVAEDAKLAADLTDLGANAANLGVARALFAQALETPGGLKIQTIHAFCERLLARFPLEAGVAPGFDVADEARAAALLGQARAEAALALDAPTAAFERFAARLGGDALDSLLDRLALRRADFHRFAATHKGGVFAEAQLRNRHGARESAEFLAATVIGGLDWGNLRQAAEELIRSTANNQKTARRIKAAVDARDAAAPVRTVFDAVLRIALKDDGSPYGALVTASVAAQQAWLTRALDSITDLAIAAREKLNQIERAEDAAAALQLALKLDTAYERAKQRGGVLDFEDLIAHAQALLARSDAAPWVLYKLDGGLDHILIDEGQDTSPGQWNLISPLQDEFFAGAGARVKPRTVFAVGDPKQSIYGFQGADPERFLAEAQTLEKRARRAKQKFVAPVLETSFRSTPEVLRAVDATFANKPLAVGEPGKHDETRHLASRDNEHGAVEVWPLAQRPLAAPAAAWDAPLDVETGASVQALLAQQIARRVKAMIVAREGVWDKHARTLRPMQAGDVLALVRTRGALFRELIRAFKRAGLPVAGADRMVLRDELAVEDCLALMRVALDPADDLALACVLKGPWCDLDDDDADILPLAWGRARGEVLHARLMANEAPKYAAARRFVGELAERAGQDPFAFLSWALETPHGEGPSGWERVVRRLGMESRDPLEELLQRALKPSSHNGVSLQRFLFEIEVDAGQVKRELEAETGAIRVMTVHGAKGLEAPVVIVPDATGPASDKPDDGLIFDEHAGPFISFRMRDDDAVTGVARAAHQQRMLSEHWRLLYVAMTRARDRLIVCGAQYGAGEAPEGWRLAVEQALRAEGAERCDTPYGEGLRLGAPVIAAAQVQSAKAHIALPTWIKAHAPGAIQMQSAAPSRIAPGDPALFSPRGDGQKRFRRGRMIHGLLERLPDITPARRTAAASTWLTRQGVKGEEAEMFAAEALAVITDPRFADLFGPLSRAEAPIVGEAAGRTVSGVVDRLAVDDKRVIVLDYKTDRPAPPNADNAPAEYVLQLALYREVLRKIFPHKIVTCALLWTEAPLLMGLPGAQLDAAFALFERG